MAAPTLSPSLPHWAPENKSADWSQSRWQIGRRLRLLFFFCSVIRPRWNRMEKWPFQRLRLGFQVTRLFENSLTRSSKAFQVLSSLCVCLCVLLTRSSESKSVLIVGLEDSWRWHEILCDCGGTILDCVSHGDSTTWTDATLDRKWHSVLAPFSSWRANRRHRGARETSAASKKVG